jgi:surfactin synthase thioesterase subunit
MPSPSATSNGPWLKAGPGASDARVRVVTFPYAGGAPAAFRTWPDALAPQVGLFHVMLPGRDRRFHETPVTRSDEIVAPVTAAVASLDDGPLVLFGHSMGSMLAFEVARALRRAGRRGPDALVVSGRGAPQLATRAPVLAHLPDAELIEQAARLFGGIPPELLREPELLQLMVKVLRADLTVVETYRYVPEEPLGCPILALGGAHDPWVSEEELAAWRQQTSAGFTSEQIPGEHFYFRTAGGERPLLARLLEYCAAVVARTTAAG